MLVNWSTVRFAAAGPRAAKAALVGAKMVTSFKPSTVETRFAVVKAPAREVRPAATAVLESAIGTVRTVSMTWMTPPLNLTS